LPTNYEWYLAAQGTPDPDTADPADDSEECNIWTNSKPTEATWSVENQAIKTGTANRCRSDAGAYDMVGNVWEWVDDTIQDGIHPFGGALPAQNYIETIDQYGIPSVTNAGAQASYNEDYFWINASGKRGFIRGGDWSNEANVGVFTFNLLYAPSNVGTSIGFRCAR